PEMVGRLWWWVCQTGLFAPVVLDHVTDRFKEIRRPYVSDALQGVSSHNDLVPRNVLFDGDRLWLIDWESAYRNDPLTDVAIALDNFGTTPEAESALLQGWCDTDRLDDATADRLDKVRAHTRLYYAGVLLSASAAMQGAVGDRDLSALTAAELENAFRRSDIVPGSAVAKHELGKVYVASFMSGQRPPGLDYALP
ncbi:phosphotransferase, partial [Nostoc sp. NIES-2111]